MARKRMADVMELDDEEALDETFEDDEAEEGPRRKVYRLTESLRVDLTQEEILEASKAMARGVDDMHELEEQRKAAAETFKARIAQARADVQVNSNLVRNGYEFRRVDIERTYDYDAGTVTTIRLDTGEIIESRHMTTDERQMTF